MQVYAQVGPLGDRSQKSQCGTSVDRIVQRPEFAWPYDCCKVRRLRVTNSQPLRGGPVWRRRGVSLHLERLDLTRDHKVLQHDMKRWSCSTSKVHKTHALVPEYMHSSVAVADKDSD